MIIKAINSQIYSNAGGNGVDKIVARLENDQYKISVSGLEGTSRFYVANLISRLTRRPFLYVTDPSRDFLAESFGFYLNAQPHLFNSKNLLNKSMLGKSRNIETHKRLTVLKALSEKQPACTDAESLYERVIPKSVFLKQSLKLKNGSELERDKLIDKLRSIGYSETDFVESPGELSIRGSIVDIFSPGYQNPIRIELLGENIRSLRLFNISSQKSTQIIDNIRVYPAREFLFTKEIEGFKNTIHKISGERGIPATLKNNFLNFIDKNHYFDELNFFTPYLYPESKSLLSYLDKKCIIFSESSIDHEKLYSQLMEGYNKHVDNRDKFKKIVPRFEESYLSPDLLKESLDRFQQIYFNDILSESESHIRIKTRSSKIDTNEGDSPISVLTQKIKKLKFGVYLVAGNENEKNKLMELFSSYNIKNATFVTGPLDTGFISNDLNIAIFTEGDLTQKGKQHYHGIQESISSAFITNFRELKSGDLIVHKQFGIGRYNGLKKIRVKSVETDYLECEYSGSDKIFVPVQNLKLIQKYVGDNKKPKIDKLGSSSWNRTIKKVKKVVENIARELLDLYARRKTTRGFQFSKRDQMFREFEMEFSYEETPDQAKTIEEVFSDMESPKPMDRLICGDVGFGKTEIAIRAALKASMDGKQTAFLVPTTLLANQHFDTFKERLENYPVIIEMISRFRSAGKSREIRKNLNEGRIDIIIGTHKLLGEKTGYKNLGLVIIDEEHKFGVKHKDKLRSVIEGVDVLSLSATPIPRSLQLSLANIRDISLINTPPEGRMPVDVYVNNTGSEIIREAVLNEIERSGSVFFINNRIENIFEVAEDLKSLIPEASIAVTHGRMNEKILEKNINDFILGKINLLVTTAIVESGLDIPRANTIIVNDAHKFGLADLYQLKGRVGRGNVKAYAYYLVPSVAKLTTESRKRLTKLTELQELGSGFNLALSDLEIRGAGNLFGEEQSGTISDVGLELYLEMLQSAVKRISEGSEIIEYEPEIKNNDPAFIPDDYISSNSERLYYYKKLSSISDIPELEKVVEELNDRFGSPPPELKTLIKVLELKNSLKGIDVLKLELKRTSASFTFSELSHLYDKFKPRGKLTIHFDVDKKYKEVYKKIDELGSEFYH